jgi:hypothetical protein
VSTLAGFAVYCIVMAFLASQTGMTTGLFATDDDAVVEGEYFDFPSAEDFDFNFD